MRRIGKGIGLLFCLSVMVAALGVSMAGADQGTPVLATGTSPHMPQAHPPVILPEPLLPEGEQMASQKDRQFARHALPDAPIDNPRLDIRALVILDTNTYTVTSGSDTYVIDFSGINAMVTGYLDILGIPYDVVDVSTRPVPTTALIDEFSLWDGVDHGSYYAILVATSTSWRPESDADQYAGLNETERGLINAYQRAFDVRKVTFYAYPNLTDYGLSYEGVVTLPTTATLTTAGQTVFGYLRPDVEITLNITGTYGYASQPGAATVTPLMTIPAAGGGADPTILAVYDDPNAGEHLAFTMSAFYPSLPPLGLFTRLLPYGMINWATRGLFLGERHLYFVGQPDDIFSRGDRWDAENRELINNGYRNDPGDIQNLIDWMSWLRSNVPNAAGFRIELPFNAEGTILDRDPPVWEGTVVSGSLTEKLLELEDQFVWLNHTYSHENLDSATIATATAEIGDNIAAAVDLGLTDSTSVTLLTGQYSGVTNTAVISAAYGLGVRYILVDESDPQYGNPTPNTGMPHPDQPNLLQVPRYANNIFYFATTPQEQTDYYNILYGTDYPTGTATYNYTQTVDLITNQALGFMLDFSINPTMFHMNNLEAYEATTDTAPILSGSHGGSRTLIGDFVESLYGKYNQYYNTNVPILSLRTQEIGERMLARQAYDDSGAAGTIACGRGITLTTQNAALVPVTGLPIVRGVYSDRTETERYAGQFISYVEMLAGETMFLSAADYVVQPAAPIGLVVSSEGAGDVLRWDPTTQDPQGYPVELLYYRVYAGGSEIGTTTTTSYTIPDGLQSSSYGVSAVVRSGFCQIAVSDTTSVVAPTAEAGPTQTVAVQDLVILDGSASTDPDGDALTYGWAQTGGPLVALSSAGAVSPTFTAPPATGVLTFSLTVTDTSGLSDSDTTSVIVTTGLTDKPPTADAGPPQTVIGGGPVVLDGSGSTDPEGDDLIYGWTQAGGTSVTLLGAETISTTFTAPFTTGVLTFTLTVTDANGLADSDTTAISVWLYRVLLPSITRSP